MKISSSFYLCQIKFNLLTKRANFTTELYRQSIMIRGGQLTQRQLSGSLKKRLTTVRRKG